MSWYPFVFYLLHSIPLLHTTQLSRPSPRHFLFTSPIRFSSPLFSLFDFLARSVVKYAYSELIWAFWYPVPVSSCGHGPVSASFLSFFLSFFHRLLPLERRWSLLFRAQQFAASYDIC